MKKSTLILALAVLGLTTMNAIASNDSNVITEKSVIANPDENTGTIISLNDNGGTLLEDGTGNVVEFINVHKPEIEIGDHYAFLKIIQSTPNGEKVIIILKTKLPA